MMAAMVHIIWIFRARPERRADFLAHYNAEGAWAQLFARARGYIRTTLQQDAADADRFLCIDAWNDLDAFMQFKREHADAYAALDRQCEQLTLEEKHIGVFVAEPH